MKSYAQESPVASQLITPIEKELESLLLKAYEGDRDAQFMVGRIYADKQFPRQDHVQAVYWYRQAARQNHPLAQYNLGHQYLKGLGVVRDEVRAMQWWRVAAEQGNMSAQFNLGRGYYLGVGVEKNHQEARKWFKKSADGGYERSLLVLKTLGWSGDPQIEASQPHVEVMPVELFTNPNRSPIVISTITDHSKLQIIKVGNNWVRCRYLGGVPVWVHGDLLEVKQNVATIIGRNVNARSHPRIADNTVVGKFRSGDQRPVLQRDGEWYRIIGLPDFLVWMKKAEYQEVFAESKKKT